MSLFTADRANDLITCPRCAQGAPRKDWVPNWFAIRAVVGGDSGGMYLKCPYTNCTYALSTLGIPEFFAYEKVED